MKVILINKKKLLLFLILILFFSGSMIYFNDIGYKVLEVLASDKMLPIYSVNTEEKKVAISFDAAWGDQFTDGILDILDKYKVKTTFFLVGFWVDRYPDMVKKIYERGHEIGNHSTTHPHMSKLSREEIIKELNTTGEKIYNITGKRPNLFRPPFGDYNNTLIKTAKECGYYTIQWDVDSLDWKELGVKPVVDRVTRNIKNGSIVLFHNNAKYVLEYLPLVIEKLQKEGYKIVPISELIIKKDYYIDHTGRQRKIDKSKSNNCIK
ncbi:polysaccharide deacetylase family sporulation protein PdaB [Caminicella sporogenes DSM 14501]|uniref:Polysaccharide deacetylase family sporulation protein PdaB n=1 Tax=Caminicella sporogenes DSM 14501 TaxID=1121266 RepID=A0A1M6R714_9FIRM|nr:polysaccharide deacetylase family sporulation protein PdaB [Caminicella sporogenes]RKD27325.1 polysaccharide deacetylase family sporulation protein PdaB [Caminicella sporogenes]SHK28233.1 polysaccharide deacetylase family sporulation protein PdaB [Caminicella sporogenes DSM 14501]